MNYFETKARFENNEGKVITETYLVKATDFAQAESMLAIAVGARGAYTAEAVRKVKYLQLFVDGDSQKYYKSKVGFIALDERAGIYKKKYVQMLVQADDIESAVKRIEKGMADTLSDYEISSVSEVPYMGYIENLSKSK